MASMHKCARPGCIEIATSWCSVCLRDQYCSGNCQKADWKAHKLICKTLKTLSKQLQPYREVVQVILQLIGAPKKLRLDVRIFEHVISYAIFQFGDRLPEKSYHERDNDDRISNWEVEMEIFARLYNHVSESYSGDESLSRKIQDDMTLPYQKKVLELLLPWFELIDLNHTSSDSLSMDQINLVLLTSSNAENIIGDIYVGRNEFGRSETHCQRALSHAKKYEGKMKTALLTSVLTNYCALRRMQKNYTDAVIFAEEAYNCVAVVYNPVHPEVQTAAGNLIECLIHKGDMYDAERFAQMTLDSLRDPGNGLDQESEEVAHGYYNLGKVIMGQDENLIRAENLTREAYRIRIQLYGIDHQFVGLTGDLIANILVRQGKLGDEIKILHEHSLASTERNEGPNGIRSAEIHAYLGNFHFLLSKEQPSLITRKEQICLAKFHYEVAVQIFTTIHGSANPCYVERLSDIKSIEAILKLE